MNFIYIYIFFFREVNGVLVLISEVPFSFLPFRKPIPSFANVAEPHVVQIKKQQ